MTPCILVDISHRNRRTIANCKADSNVGLPGLCIADKQTRWNTVLLEELSSLASQGTARILWNPKVHYRTQNRAPHVRGLTFRSSPRPPILVLRSILILFSHLCLGFPSDLFPSGFLTKTLCAFRFSPCVPHAPPISSSLIWSTKHYLVSDPYHFTFPLVFCHLVLLKLKYLPQHPVRRPGWLRAVRSRDRNPIRAKFSAPVQTGPGGPPSLLHSRYRVSFRGKAAGAWRWLPTPNWRRV